MGGKSYNRTETWGELYDKYEETLGEDSLPQNEGSFAELFASAGMKGFKPKEQDLAATSSDRHEPRYPQIPQEVLDLHGLTTDETEREVEKFIMETRERGLVFLLIITGRGANSPGGSSKLRPLTVQILNHMITGQRVRSFRTADPKDGGFGALYVYLK